MLFYLLSCCDDVCFAARAYYAMAVFFSSSFSFATPPSSTTTAGGAGPQAEGLLVALFVVPSSLPGSAAEGPAHGNVANAQNTHLFFCVVFFRHLRKTTHPTPPSLYMGGLLPASCLVHGSAVQILTSRVRGVRQ